MKCLSLFANIGVGNAYAEEMGVEIVVANEIDASRCKVYKQIYPNTDVISGDITKSDVQNHVTERSLALDVQLIFATPPCQGFSTLNSKNKNDSRNSLVYDFCKVVNNIKPKYMMLENVPRIMQYKIEGKYITDILTELLPDYSFVNSILDAKNFDTPQTRRRAIFLFTKKGEKKWGFTLSNVCNKIISLRDAIGSFPSLESGEDKSDWHRWHFAQKHSENHIIWMKNTPTGKSAFENKLHYPSVIEDGKKRKIKGYLNTYKRMEWDQPAPTLIKGCTMISSSNTVHPGRPLLDGLYSDSRTLSVYEAMIIMGLPCDWMLPSYVKYRDAISYLGEGICPKLVKSLLNSLP